MTGMFQEAGVRVVVQDGAKYMAEVNRLTGATNAAFGGVGKSAAKSLVGMGALTVGVGALTTVIGGSIGAASKFEHAVDQVGAVSGATDKEMKKLGDTALRIGKDTAFGATEAAGAMEILAANGVSATDIMEGAADAAVALAAAGGTDLKTAADVASTSMAVWGLKTSDMTDVVNRLAGAANVSRFGVEDMALAVAQGGGAAKTAGVEFGDFTTAIAAIAPSFSSGSDAGTSFKTFLIGLTGTSDKAKDKMKELGIITRDGSNSFFDATGKMKSMADVTQILHDATASLSEQQKIEALQTIFGTDAMRAAAAVAQLTGAEFQKMSDTMRDTSAAEIAAKRMDNFNGAMEQLKGSIEVLMIQIGMKLLPVLTDLALFLAKTIPAAVNESTPYLEAFGSGLALIFDILAPGARLLMDNAEAIKILVLGFAAWKALAIGSMILTTITSISAMSVAVGILQAQMLLLNAAMLAGLGLLAMFVVPPVIDGIGKAFFGANDEAENFAAGAQGVQKALQDMGGTIDAVSLQVLTNDLRDVGKHVLALPGFFDDAESSLGGMVQGALDSGVTYEQAMKMVKDAGLENVPAVQQVFADLEDEMRKTEIAAMEVAEAQTREMTLTRIHADQELPATADQFLTFSRTVITSLDEVGGELQILRDEADEKFEDVAKSVAGLAPTLDMEVDKWLEDIRRATAVYTEYETNINSVLDAIEQQYPEHFETVGQIMLQKSPEEIAAWAQLATDDSTAFGEGIVGISTLTSGELDRVKTETQARFGPFRNQYKLLGEEATAGWSIGLFPLAEMTNIQFAKAYDAAARAIGAKSPADAFIKLGEYAVEGFEVGLAGLPDVAAQVMVSAVTRLMQLQSKFTELNTRILYASNDAVMQALMAQRQAVLSEMRKLDAEMQAAPQTMYEAGAATTGFFGSGVSSGLTSLEDIMAQMAKVIYRDFDPADPDSVSFLMNFAGKDAVDRLAQAILNGTPDVEDALDGIVAAIKRDFDPTDPDSVAYFGRVVGTMLIADFGDAIMEGVPKVADSVEVLVEDGIIRALLDKKAALQFSMQQLSEIVGGLAGNSAAQLDMMPFANELLLQLQQVDAEIRAYYASLPPYTGPGVVMEGTGDAVVGGSDNPGGGDARPTYSFIGGQLTEGPPQYDPNGVFTPYVRDTVLARNFTYLMNIANALGMTFDAVRSSNVYDIISRLNTIGNESQLAQLANTTINSSVWQGFMRALRGNGLTFDNGGWLMPGLTLAMNNTGRPERVLAPSQSRHGYGDTIMSMQAPINITVNSNSNIDWGSVRSMVYSAVDDALGRARNQTVRAGVMTNQGVG